MTPKEEAKELVKRYTDFNSSTLQMMNGKYSTGIAKQFALIAVEFAMNSPYSFKPMEGGWISGKMYYQEVKQEIELL